MSNPRLPKLSSHRLAILRLAESGKGYPVVTPRAAAEALGVRATWARQAMAELAELGHLRPLGGGYVARRSDRRDLQQVLIGCARSTSRAELQAACLAALQVIADQDDKEDCRREKQDPKTY